MLIAKPRRDESTLIIRWGERDDLSGADGPEEHAITIIDEERFDQGQLSSTA